MFYLRNKTLRLQMELTEDMKASLETTNERLLHVLEMENLSAI